MKTSRIGTRKPAICRKTMTSNSIESTPFWKETVPAALHHPLQRYDDLSRILAQHERRHDDHGENRREDRRFARNRKIAVLDRILDALLGGFFCLAFLVGTVGHARPLLEKVVAAVLAGVELDLAALRHFEGRVGDRAARLQNVALRRCRAVGELAFDHAPGA